MPEQRMNTAFERFTSGLYVITAQYEGEQHAAVVSLVSQVSFVPPMVMIALRKGTRICNVVRDRKRFALNIVGEGQEALAKTFFKLQTGKESTLGGFRFRTGQTGSALFEDTPAWVECKVMQMVESDGDHQLYLALIVDHGTNNDLPPLTLKETNWSYNR